MKRWAVLLLLVVVLVSGCASTSWKTRLPISGYACDIRKQPIGPIPQGFRFEDNPGIVNRTTEHFLANYASLGMPGYRRLIELQGEYELFRAKVFPSNTQAEYQGDFSLINLQLENEKVVPVAEALAAPVDVEIMMDPSKAKTYILHPRIDSKKVTYEELAGVRGRDGSRVWYVYLAFPRIDIKPDVGIRGVCWKEESGP